MISPEGGARPAGRPRTVFFDLGQVLCRFDWGPSLQALAERLGADPAVITRWLMRPEGPHDAYCRGAIDERQLLDAVHRDLDPERRIENAWLVDLWCDIFSPLEGALELVERLRGQCHRGIISNTNRLHFECLDRRLDLQGRMDSLTLSYRVGSLKPVPGIYHAALDAAGCRPQDVFYVDDQPEFVEAARALGWQAEVFRSVGALRRTLKAMGFEV